MRAATETDRIRTLLQESDWVRRLAARLVTDPNDAEDVVQDTYAAALRRPPTWSESPRQWLATVARNGVRHRARGARARRERESAWEREQGDRTAASPEELIERLELQEQLSRLVRELPEELADVVTLRFYEGLSSAEIARRRELPPGTVRSRLSRGLEILRHDLDRKFDGDRPGWIAALVPLARPADGAGTIGGLGGILNGLLAYLYAMPLLAKVVTVSLALLLCALPFTGTEPPWVGERGAVPGGAPPVSLARAADDSRERAPAAQPRRAEVASAATDRAGDAEARDTPDAPWTRAHLRVVDTFGHPVAGAQVALEPTPETRRDLERRVRELGPLAALPALAEFEKSTGADGVVRFETNVLNADGSAIAVVRGPDFERATLHFPFRSGEELDLGELVLEPAGAVAGVVRDASGTPFQSAFLSMGPVELPRDRTALENNGPAERVGHAQTDERGRYELVGVPAGTYRVFAHAGAGRWTWSEPVEIVVARLAGSVDLELPDERGRRAELVVLGPDGAPWPHASYRMTGPLGGVFSGPLGDDGHSDFTMAWGSFGGGRLVVHDQKLLHHAVVVDPLPLEPQPIEVRLERAATVERELVVTDSSGEALADARITVTALGSESTVEADTDGRARLHLPAPPQAFDVVVRAAGHAPSAQVGLVAPAPDTPWQVSVEPLPGIGGVVTAGGEPLRNARVTLHALVEEGTVVATGNAVGRFEPHALQSARTDESGSFTLHWEEDARLLVRVEHRRHADAFAQLPFYEASAGRQLDVELGRGGTIEGRVLHFDGTPAAGMTVLLDHEFHPGSKSRTDAEGRFRFRRVAAGSWSVQALASVGEAVVTATVRPVDWEYPRTCTVREDETTPCELVLPDPAQLRIDVRASLEGAEVGSPSVHAGVPTEWDPGAGLSWLDALPTAEGQRLTLARRVRHRVGIGAEGMEGFFRRDVGVDELPATLEVHLPLATLAGRVLAVPPGGSYLTVEGTVDGWTFTAHVTLDETGEFGPLVVPATALRLRGAARGTTHCEASVELALGESRTVTL